MLHIWITGLDCDYKAAQVGLKILQTASFLQLRTLTPSRHRMSVLLLLALCTLAMGCGASYPPQPAIMPSPLLSLDCNSSYVLDIASDILQDINRDRQDGYVLSLNRVRDAREHRQGVSGGPRWGRCLHKLGRLARAWEPRDTSQQVLSKSETLLSTRCSPLLGCCCLSAVLETSANGIHSETCVLSFIGTLHKHQIL